VPALSRRLGYQRYERLYQVDPVLCRRITARHRACTRTHWWKQPGAKRICEIDVIRSALEQSLAQDPPVSVRRIAMHLGYANGGLIQRKFPDLCHAIAQKLEDCKKRRFVALKQAVAAASLDDPPPTLHSLSRRLGFGNSSTLRSRFRDETDRVLAARVLHAQQETQSSEPHYSRFCAESQLHRSAALPISFAYQFRIWRRSVQTFVAQYGRGTCGARKSGRASASGC
jgi:hypothetical protein